MQVLITHASGQLSSEAARAIQVWLRLLDRHLNVKVIECAAGRLNAVLLGLQAGAPHLRISPGESEAFERARLNALPASVWNRTLCLVVHGEMRSRTKAMLGPNEAPPNQKIWTDQAGRFFANDLNKEFFAGLQIRLRSFFRHGNFNRRGAAGFDWTAHDLSSVKMMYGNDWSGLRAPASLQSLALALQPPANNYNTGQKNSASMKSKHQAPSIQFAASEVQSNLSVASAPHIIRPGSSSRNKLSIRTRTEDAALFEALGRIEGDAWANLGFLKHARAQSRFFKESLERFPDYQLCLVDENSGEIVGSTNAVPIACGDTNALPPEGWDWLVQMGATGLEGRNWLGCLSVTVPAMHRSKGYARRMVHALLMLAAKRGFRGVIVPVRPSAKEKYPAVEIEKYITWTDEKGRPFDPRIRSHLNAGGHLVKPAPRSIVLSEPVKVWECWTGQRFEQTGAYMCEGGIAPVQMDLEAGIGLYVEPGVWFSYQA